MQKMDFSPNNILQYYFLRSLHGYLTTWGVKKNRVKKYSFSNQTRLTNIYNDVIAQKAIIRFTGAKEMLKCSEFFS
jgi:hypothetical protein